MKQLFSAEKNFSSSEDFKYDMINTAFWKKIFFNIGNNYCPQILITFCNDILYKDFINKTKCFTLRIEVNSYKKSYTTAVKCTTCEQYS